MRDLGIVAFAVQAGTSTRAVIFSSGTVSEVASGSPSLLSKGTGKPRSMIFCRNLRKSDRANWM